MVYNPQGLIRVDRLWKRPRFYDSEHKINRPSHKLERIIKFTNYPNTILCFPNPNRNSCHPTQKPIALFKYLIKTYTEENEIVLDNCMGSGTTAIAAEQTKRNWFGIDNNEHYVVAARERIEKERAKYPLFQPCIKGG